MKVAIAEQDGSLGRLIRSGLLDEVDEVVEIRNPAEFYPALDRANCNVLIFDWPLHALDNAELRRRLQLRGQMRTYLFVIAVLPASADPDARLDAFGAGVDLVLLRPCDPHEIAAGLDAARRITRHEQSLLDRSEELEQIRLDLESENANLSEIATRDALTGLRNRRYFCEMLDSQFLLARRKGLPLSLVMIDVDQFKPFNDQYGHLAGDEVLKEVGKLLHGCIRDHDVVARFGGEEFAILLPATDEDECLPMVDRLRLKIAAHPWPLRPVTISLGVATLSLRERQPSDLIDQADRTLYYSKAMGRNRATHARELSELAGDQATDRLGNGIMLFDGGMAEHSYSVAGNTTLPGTGTG